MEHKMKKRIIFVDDETNVLQGLKRTLRVMQNDWDMSFTESGQKALDIMKETPFDIIVADMRMPRMNGVQLLEKVRALHPEVIRIILSGSSDEKTIMKSVRVAHQYLAKPCDTETVKGTVERTWALHGLLNKSSLKSIVSQVESLPSIPSLYAEILEELNSTHSSLKKIGEIVSKDLGMTTKMLQIVNSAFFGIPRHIENPMQAVNLLGIETVKALVLTIEIFSRFKQKKIPGFSLEKLWTHSMNTGAIAKEIARHEKMERELIDDTFFAGLLHDTGKLILAANFSTRFLEVLKLSKKENMFPCLAEQELLGTSHAELGAYLLGLWGLPKSIIEAVAFHHFPRKLHSEGFGILAAVHTADAMDYENVSENAENLENGRLDYKYLEELGLTEKLDFWRGIEPREKL